MYQKTSSNGAFDSLGTFHSRPLVDSSKDNIIFREKTFAMLKNHHPISDALIDKMHSWRNSSFSVHLMSPSRKMTIKPSLILRNILFTPPSLSTKSNISKMLIALSILPLCIPGKNAILKSSLLLNCLAHLLPYP